MKGIIFALMMAASTTFMAPAAWSLPTKIRVMTYNAENFYDATHDEGTEDYQYLPLNFKRSNPEAMEYCRSLESTTYRDRCFNMDWNDAAFRAKAKNLAQVIKASGDTTPDIIVFEEVENLNAVTKLVEWELADQGYKEILLVEGPDKRGIDVAIISKFPLGKEVKYHQIDLSPIAKDPSKVKLTRGILEATFNINGQFVTVMANHWPSQNNPSAARVIAAQVFVKAVSEAEGYVIAAGDFNTIDSDKPHGINEYLLNPARALQFFDFEKVFFGEQLDGAAPHRGTHFYRGEWSSLDKIFLVKGQNQLVETSVKPDWKSYNVVKKPFMLGKDGGPMEFNPNSKKGYSDHLPVQVEFVVD